MHGISTPEALVSADFNNGNAWYFAAFGTLILIYFVAALRTNIVFALLFLFLDVQFWCLSTACAFDDLRNAAPSLTKPSVDFKVGSVSLAHVDTILKAGSVTFTIVRGNR